MLDPIFQSDACIELCLDPSGWVIKTHKTNKYVGNSHGSPNTWRENNQSRQLALCKQHGSAAALKANEHVGGKCRYGACVLGGE